ncbi:MAG: DNA polymerase III subunit, partial [Planctomycetes bacterium]|nr:DNA polymerase III subunit [Planctomycetota bacterium]
MSLADVRYQDHAFRQVQRALAANRLPHAYLFHGPHGVGKETFANGLAQTLLCDAPEDVSSLSRACQQAGGAETVRVACGKCKECELVHARTHPDLHVIFRQLNREHPDPVVRKRKALIISVDVVREFITKPIALKPTRGRIKVFVVREADRTNEQAQNALLKTLEEPPGSALLVLLVDSIDRMLPTTLSRCQVVRFDALPVAFVQEKLAELVPDLDGDRAAWYARSSDGSLGAALERVENEWYELNGQLLGDLPELATRRSDAITKQWLDSAKALGAKCRK